jgi:succinate-acetate transporter protein
VSASDTAARRRDVSRSTSASAPTVADPAPLGLAAFALTTFVLSCFNAKIVGDPKLEAVVLPLALFYGGTTQLLAGMWEFRTGNTFGALAFSSYGAFWLSFAGYAKFVVPGLPPAGAHVATGLFLLAWTIFTVYMTVAAIRVSGAVLLVLVALSLTFLSLTLGALMQSDFFTRLGGWLGLVTAVAAWYASFAGVTNATWKRIVLPTWPAKQPA